MDIQVRVNDDLVSHLGEEAILKKMQKWLEWEELRMLALHINKGIEEAGLKADDLFQTARSEGWKEYKKNNLPFLPNS